MSNVSSLNDLRKKQEGEEEENKKNDEFFAGGLDQRGGGSGLAVVGPDASRSNGIFDSLVEKASREQPNDYSSESSGTGSNSSSTLITLYRNGFTVNDGPLRDLTSPQNTSFLDSLMQGRIPQELGGDARAGTIDVQLADKRSEDYKTPAYVAFSGPSSTLRSNDHSDPNGFVFSTDSLMEVEAAVVNEAEPVTLLQVRTEQGKKMRIKVNCAISVLQLGAVIMREIGDSGASFTLTSGFPPSPVMDVHLSVEAAGLKGAAITLKNVN